MSQRFAWLARTAFAPAAAILLATGTLGAPPDFALLETDRASEAFLLDRIRPCWREDYLRRLFTLDAAFARESPCENRRGGADR